MENTVKTKEELKIELKNHLIRRLKQKDNNISYFSFKKIQKDLGIKQNKLRSLLLELDKEKVIKTNFVNFEICLPNTTEGVKKLEEFKKETEITRFDKAAIYVFSLLVVLAITAFIIKKYPEERMITFVSENFKNLGELIFFGIAAGSIVVLIIGMLIDRAISLISTLGTFKAIITISSIIILIIIIVLSIKGGFNR